MIFVVIAVIGIIFIGKYFKGSQNKLPDSFTIKLYADFSSSGASRYYNAILTFQNNKLISGWEREEVWSGSGSHRIYECIVDPTSLTWIDKETSEECEIFKLFITEQYGTEFPPLQKELLEKEINSEEIIKPSNRCFHGDICYEMQPNP